MPLRHTRDMYSNLYEKFKQDHQTSGAFWSSKRRYVELYEYTLELESQTAPKPQPTGEMRPMNILFSMGDIVKMIEAYVNENVVKQPIEIENLHCFSTAGGKSIDIETIEIECKPKPTA